MNKLCLLSCLVLAVSAHAQTKPKVVFAGDQSTYAWQQSAAFKANPNWIGAGLPGDDSYGASGRVAADFQTVLNQHPDYVFLTTGAEDVGQGYSEAIRWGMQFEGAAIGIIDIVQMAKKANVKIIIGNLIGEGFTNTWLQAFGQNENVPIVNFADALNVGCNNQVCPLYDPNPTQSGGPFSITVPNSAGFQVITQMAPGSHSDVHLEDQGRVSERPLDL
jgi:hypothetical protein